MRECKGLGVRLLNFNNTACLLLPTTVVYTVTETMSTKEVTILCLCSSQTEWNIALILLLLDNLLMFHQASGVNSSFNMCGMLEWLVCLLGTATL